MPLHWPTFFTRLGSAIVFSAVMMAGLLWHDWMFVALVALIHGLCLRDFFRLMGKIEGADYPVWLRRAAQGAGLIALFVAGWQATMGFDLHALAIRGAATHLLIAAMASVVLILAYPISLLLITGLSEKYNYRQGFSAIAALFYITLPMMLLIALHLMAWQYPLALILMIWMNDTMAYLVGSFIGKTPFSKISPKKTWEGTAGGALLTIAGAGIAAWLIPGQSMAVYLGMAVCAAVAGTAGDLFESKLKRLAGVKDSGAMMPGHGGALDRFDSLLVATPFAFAWVWMVQ